MKRSRIMTGFTIFGLSAVVGVLFQNCSGANKLGSADSTVSSSSLGQVPLANPVAVASLPATVSPTGSGGSTSSSPVVVQATPAQVRASLLIGKLYRGLLQRQATDAEVAGWVNQNLSCPALIYGIVASPEATDASKYRLPFPDDFTYAYTFYLGVLNRAPEPGVIENTILPYMQDLERTGTQAAARQQLIANFVASPEVTQVVCPNLYGM